MSLRTILSAVIVLLASITLVVGVAFAALTSSLHAVAAIATDAVESVRLTAEATRALRAYASHADSELQAAARGDVRRALAELEPYVTSAEERAAASRATSMTERYFAVPWGTSEELAREARNAVADLARINLAQAREARNRAASMDRMADAIALAALGISVMLGALALWWLNAKAFRPTLSLARAMEGLSDGGLSSRAEERGPRELREMAVRFNRIARQLAAQREARAAFLAGVVHDLRTPLGALKLAVARVDPELPLPPEPALRKSFALVDRQIGRLESMLGDFQDLSKIEAGELELRIAPHDVRELAREATELFAESSPAHAFELSLPQSAVPCACDPVRVQQVLNNLLSNAVKYSPTGGAIVVTVATEDDLARITVADCGPGIPESERGLIFEPFARLRLGKRNVPGIGMGLFISRRIVEAHDGRIAVQSAPGGGSAFDVWLPLAVQEAPRRKRARMSTLSARAGLD